MQPRNEQIAQIAMLSGDEQLARFGKVLLDDEQRKAVLRQHQTEFEHRKSQPIHMGEGFLYDPASKRAAQDPNYSAYADKQHRQSLERIGAQQRGTLERQQTITGTERANLADLDSKLQLGRDALAMLSENPNAVEAFADTATNVVKGFWPDMGNLIESSHKSEAELDTLNKMRRFIAGIRKSELGSALTGYELTKGAEWDPTAGGISAAESARRLNNLVRYLDQEFETLRGGRPLRASASNEQEEPTSAEAEQEWILDEQGNPVRIR
jgi:hypothetical protein